MPRIAGFLPSTSGFHFANAFPHVPLRTIHVPGIGVDVPILDAANGLCGGMVYAVRDYFEHGMTPPKSTTPPSDGPLFDYLVQRLFESWDIPGGILRYVFLMNPELADLETPLTRLTPFPHARTRVMIEDEWPKVKADLDGGQPSPLGLIKVKSADPALLGRNHQVLAYGYDLVGAELTLHLYDPNFPDDDHAALSLSIADPSQPCNLTCSTAPELYCFFRTAYTRRPDPPPVVHD